MIKRAAVALTSLCLVVGMLTGCGDGRMAGDSLSANSSILNSPFINPAVTDREAMPEKKIDLPFTEDEIKRASQILVEKGFSSYLEDDMVSGSVTIYNYEKDDKHLLSETETTYSYQYAEDWNEASLISEKPTKTGVKKVTYEYDGDLLVSETTSYEGEDYSSRAEWSKISYTYDNHGNITSETRSSSENPEKKYRYYAEYEYADDGQISTKSEWGISEADCTVSFENIKNSPYLFYTYKDGHPYTMTEVYSGRTSEECEYEYDEKGKLVKEVSHYYGVDGNCVSTTTYEYTDDGKIERSAEYCLYSGASSESLTDEYKYEYYKDGSLKRVLYRCNEDNDFSISEEYDEHGLSFVSWAGDVNYIEEENGRLMTIYWCECGYTIELYNSNMELIMDTSYNGYV